MNVAFLTILACTGGGREWAGGADRALEDPDTDAVADTDTGTGSDTDPDDSGPAVDTDTGLPPLEGDPCMRTIPADALVVRDDRTEGEDRVVAWVCRPNMYSTSGDEVTLFVEGRADALLSGTGGRAWVRASGRLHVYAGPNEVWVEEGAEVTVEAEGVVVETCPAIVLTGGPGEGC